MSTTFETGAAMVDISPDDNYLQLRREAGETSWIEGVLEPIWVRTLVTRCNGLLLGLITGDLSIVTPWFTKQIQQALQESHGIEPTHIAIVPQS